ncbi:MAG: PD-(D/E)XK nuclease family protein [Pyramidobacter sp.]|nr:PD-(D/E)XK nuclease family protein [Pyramidobacter sp.]
MPFTLWTYRRVSDLERQLRTLPPADGRMFLVAGSGDRELLRSILAGSPAGAREYAIRRWDELYRYFSDALEVEKPRVQLDPPDHWLLLRGLLDQRIRSGAPLPPGAFRRGFISILGSQIRELISEEIMPEHLEGLFCEDDVLGRSFIELYRGYCGALDANGLSDSAGVTTQTRLLLGDGSEDACRKLDLTLVGFSSLTHSQLELVRALVRRGASVRFCAPAAPMKGEYGAAQQFGTDGEDLSRNFEPFRVLRLESGDPRQEFETVARTLALWEQGEGALAARAEWPGWERIAVSVPRSRLGEAREVFSRYDLPCFWNFRLKVSETPLWRLSSACLEAASGAWQTEPVLRLLAQPWLCGASVDVQALRRKRPRGADAWRNALEGDERSAFDACCAYAEKIRSGGTALELLTALHEFAAGRALSVARAVEQAAELDDEIRVFCEAQAELERKILFIREVVRDLGEFCAQRLSGAEAAAYLSAWADGTTVDQGVQFSGSMNVFADTPPTLFHAPYWIMTGAAAPNWPGGLKESPMLADEQKEELHALPALSLDRTHLPLLAEQRKQREFLFRRLAACGDVCTIIARSATDDEDRPLDETAFVSAAAEDGWIQPFDAAGETLTASLPKAPDIARGLDRLLGAFDETILTPVETRSPDLTAEHTLPNVRTRPEKLDIAFGSLAFSAVDEYSGCPYRFALSRLMKYEEPLRDGEYDVLRGGSAVHALWEEVWKRYLSEGARTISGLVSEMADGILEQTYPELLSSPALRRARCDLMFRVERCARLQDSLEEVLAPQRLESKLEFTLPPYVCGGVTFHGRCDRLDILEDGRFFLWDYKAGRGANYKRAFQLPCYALALKESPDWEIKVCAGWGYVGLKDACAAGFWDGELNLPGNGKPVSGQSKATMESQLDDARELLRAIAQSAQSGQYIPNYTSSSCTYCSFAALCRRGEMSAEAEDSDGEEGNSNE